MALCIYDFPRVLGGCSFPTLYHESSLRAVMLAAWGPWLRTRPRLRQVMKRPLENGESAPPGAARGLHGTRSVRPLAWAVLTPSTLMTERRHGTEETANWWPPAHI